MLGAAPNAKRSLRRTIAAGCDWLRGRDLNPRPLGYEPNELPDCSTPRHLPCYSPKEYHGRSSIDNREDELSWFDEAEFTTRHLFYRPWIAAESVRAVPQLSVLGP